MADKVRLGLIGASVSGTWSARAHLPALRASAEVELTGGLHHPGGQRRGGASGVGRAAGL